MTEVKTVNIHGKDYVPVSERVRLAHEECKKISITTDLVSPDSQVIVKATVVTPKGTFTGYSAANPEKLIEKQSPIEVAETSAVGRALGFAGYGIVEGIATADEVVKANGKKTLDEAVDEVIEAREDYCPIHKTLMKERVNGQGQKYHDHRARLNDNKEFDQSGSWYTCQGEDWVISSFQK